MALRLREKIRLHRKNRQRFLRDEVSQGRCVSFITSANPCTTSPGRIRCLTRQECLAGCWLPVPSLTWVWFSHSCAAYQGKTSVSTVGTSTSAYRLSLATMSRSNTGTGTVWEQDSEPSQQASQDTLSRTDEEDEESTWQLIWAKPPTITKFSWCPRGWLGGEDSCPCPCVNKRLTGAQGYGTAAVAAQFMVLKLGSLHSLLIPSGALGREKGGHRQIFSVWDLGWHAILAVLTRHLAISPLFDLHHDSRQGLWLAL